MSGFQRLQINRKYVQIQNVRVHIGTHLERNKIFISFKSFLLRDDFPIIISILILIGFGLDIGITYNMLLMGEYGLSYEANPIARTYIGTELWFIHVLVTTIYYSFVIWLSYIDRHIGFRFLLLFLALQPYRGFYSWIKLERLFP